MSVEASKRRFLLWEPTEVVLPTQDWSRAETFWHLTCFTICKKLNKCLRTNTKMVPNYLIFALISHLRVLKNVSFSFFCGIFNCSSQSDQLSEMLSLLWAGEPDNSFAKYVIRRWALTHAWRSTTKPSVLLQKYENRCRDLPFRLSRTCRLSLN